MTSLVRFLATPGLWAELPDDGPIVENCPVQLLIELFQVKGKGASYWKLDVRDEMSLNRTIAAYSATQNAMGGVSLVHAEIAQFDSLGINYKTSPSTNPDSEWGEKSHVDVNVGQLSKALHLISTMRSTVRHVSAAAVKGHFFDSVKSGQINLDKVSDKFLSGLVKSKHLVFI